MAKDTQTKDAPIASPFTAARTWLDECEKLARNFDPATAQANPMNAPHVQELTRFTQSICSTMLSAARAQLDAAETLSRSWS